MEEVTFRDGQRLWWSGGKGGCSIGPPPERRERRFKVISYKAWVALQEEEADIVDSCCASTEPRRRKSTGQSDSKMTPPGDEDKTHPWSSSFHAPGVQRHIWPFLQFLELGVERGNGLWVAVLVRHCSARGKETPHQRDTA